MRRGKRVERTRRKASRSQLRQTLQIGSNDDRISAQLPAVLDGRNWRKRDAAGEITQRIFQRLRGIGQRQERVGETEERMSQEEEAVGSAAAGEGGGLELPTIWK